MENKNRSCCNVCVTGGSGYIGSSLVKKLLEQGHTVHSTLRNLNDISKVEILKSFPGANERLKLFEADIYKAEEFEAAIQGCEFVFHVATPLLHTEGHQHKNRIDATVDAVKRIANACIRSGTVKRLIYTASVMAASPLKHDGSGYKEFMDESCWTPMDLSIPYGKDFLEEYTKAKTLAEQELLTIAMSGEMEIVALACGLVGGESLMPITSGSVLTFLAPITNEEFACESLKVLGILLGNIPVLHIEDATNAHIFCMEQVSMSGRFLCSNAYVSTMDIAGYYKKMYPHFSIKKELLEGLETETKWGSSLLSRRGFEYKFSWQVVLDDSVSFARKIGDVKL